MVRALRRPPRRRRDSGAGEPRMSRVLHVLPAPDSGVAIAAPPSNILDELERTHGAADSPVCRLSRSPVHAGPRPVPGTVRRIGRAACKSASSARRASIVSIRNCSRLHAAGLRAMSFGVETVSRETLRRSAAGRFPRRTSAIMIRIAASSGSSPRRSTCSGSSRTTGRRSRRRSTTRSISAPPSPSSSC